MTKDSPIECALGKQMGLTELQKQVKTLADPETAAFLQRFFKTGPGEYGEGDRFVGIRVPTLRKLAKAHGELPLSETLSLLRSPIHEERLLALIILVENFRRETAAGKERIYHKYLSHTHYINNWDLVDCSAEHIVGAFLFDRDRSPLYRLARSEILWNRRIAMLSTFHFIKREDFEDTLHIADILKSDPEDLIHKAVGWMLREVGKRDLKAEEMFLKPRYRSLPRTLLRYAIEKFPEPIRQRYLKGEI